MKKARDMIGIGWLVSIMVMVGLPAPGVVEAQLVLLNETGRLEDGDKKLPKGEFYDQYEFAVQRGQAIRAEMTSRELDTYLILRSPSGQLFGNDDWEGNTDRSRIDLAAPEAGRWTAMATSCYAGETGRYSLRIEGVNPPLTTKPPAPGEQGTLLRRREWLTTGQPVLPKGEFYVEYMFNVQQGQPIRVTLDSDDFDTYLILASPSGQTWVNDDWEAGTNSRIDLLTSEDGQWKVTATSLAPGGMGAFDLHVWQLSADSSDVQAAPQPGTQAVLLEETGRLHPGCDKLPTGEYVNRHTFQVASAQTIRVEMTSQSFDTYIVVLSPSGRNWENDDWQGRKDVSRLDLVTPEPGTWTVVATSFAAGERGAYNLRVEQMADE